ncbi:F-box protein FBW2-like [Gossypium arboreum]|uniref:F-box protein FBW2-like n=1 Tax=Gossypium arboreum TaxID=29729 RepID=UPI0008196C1B|nr:F-box protein FBW2-like [Gossypium arboreum]
MEEEQSEFRHWDELLPDVLGLIFSYLSLKELLKVIPCVCKSWSKAVMGPLCWQYIDLFQWSIRWQPHQLDRMLRMLVTRSCGSLRSLHVAGLQNDSNFSFITENAGSLRVLRLPRSEISGSIVEETAQRLSTITFLDLSHCPKIGAKAIEAIGKHCKFLVTLCRNIHFLDSAGKVELEDEANAIAATMPRLKHLELRCHFISTECVLKILSGCPHLEHLDIKGCLEVELDHQFLKDKFPKLKNLLELRLRNVGGPYIGYHEFIDWIYGFSYLRMWVECWLNGEIKLPLSVIECAIPCPSYVLQFLLSL